MISTDQAEEFCDDLLANIEERRVIPIVGPELLTFERDGARIGFNRLVAEKLTAARMSIRRSAPSCA